MFVDTSAIVAILCREYDATELAQRLAAAERRYTSPVVRLEACMVLASRLDVSPAQANALFDDFVGEADLSIISINDEIGALAVACFEAFGKGRHPARLNLGDCLSYACAKAYRSPLLFKGDDFSQTDMASTNPNRRLNV
ncbi:type II toxin-antitoxin system VapC family toxin [Methylocystis heyeri]|uniref:Ribonuclease VapC n=1 Tax=Methylocystis heyeri TaxID=391905 RepID=A0A6B8KJY6_9HYPH|nr:type II toxin-antitoxin system VapC family toxin [Methylocystis heyeri]QGM47401.1 PIN domain-containing protein [Methylocystis heyeri]